jgi:glycosyltransferase involved in cell wall biosynthesis
LCPQRYGVWALPWFIADMARVRRDLIRLVRKYEIDVVQTHLLEMLDFVAASLRYGTDVEAILWTIHNVNFLPAAGNLGDRLRRLTYRWLYRWLSSKVDGFIAVSDEVCRSVVRHIDSVQDKVITIPNGVDMRRYHTAGIRHAILQELGLGTEVLLMVTVGRLTEQKGHRYLIDSATRVVPRLPNAHFLFVGDGELRDSLRAQTETLGVSEHIHFLGIRDAVPDILAAADIFILPSLWEGLSIALLEAMASAKPIVATAVSGTTQVMIPGETGVVVPPGDSRALAEAILQVSSNPEQAQVMGQAARQHVAAHFSAQKQADEHLALYRRLVNVDQETEIVSE